MKFDYSKLEPEIRHLSNGVPVYAFADRSMELVRLEFIFEAGSFFQQKKLQAAACCALTGAGTQNFSSREWAEKLDYYGAYVERYPDKDQATLVFYCLSRYFKEIIPLCEEAVKRSVFPQEELETYLRKQHRKFLVNREKVSELSRTEFYSLVFGQHPYGQSTEESDFTALKREDLLVFHQRHYVADNCKIVLAGGYTDQDLNLLETCFGGREWTGTETVTASGLVALPGFSGNQRVDKPKEGSLQASVRIGMPLCPLDDPDFASFKVTDYVLGGYFGSRLMRNIREEKGYTYGISSYIIPLRQVPVWMISSEVKADCTGKVLAEIEKEIAKLQKKPIPDSELDIVRQSFMGDFVRELDGTFDLAERMKFFILCGVGADFYRRNEEVFFSITPEEIRQMACRYLTPDRFYTVTVGAL
ncbi:MAG: insulinase family protein [Bacteroides sp.]|nr:insulinase family protein [Bacteroides sp.]MCM1085567.1 insulinase family protein [Bacteroides sp.]